MSFAGAPAAAAGTRGDDNAGEDDQAASVLGVQTEPQLQSGLVIRHSSNLYKHLWVNK